MNYLRINEDDTLKFPCETEENEEENTVTITDVSECNFKGEDIVIHYFEVVDENNVLWAMRRLPKRLHIHLNSAVTSLQVNWKLSICKNYLKKE